MATDATAATQQHFYRHSGVVIASEFELPEWRCFSAHDAGTSDVRISLQDEPNHIVHPEKHGIYDGAKLQFSVRDVGGWSVEAGDRILVYPDGHQRLAELRLFTLGSAWGALGYQRGWPMLHGSSVDVAGRAVLFCGDAGQGKSTMAGGFLRGGNSLIADDLSRVELQDGVTSIYPSAGRLKLWDTALEHFGLTTVELERDHFRDRKFHLPIEAAEDLTVPRPLAAIFVLEWGDEISVTRLRGGIAVRALCEATMYRKEYLELMGLLGEQVVYCARIAASTPIYRLTRPKDFARLNDACGAVYECVQ